MEEQFLKAYCLGESESRSEVYNWSAVKKMSEGEDAEIGGYLRGYSSQWFLQFLLFS